MSQQAQAEGAQRQGLQDWSEVQAQVVALQAKRDKGEIADEALDAEISRLNDAADAAEQYFARAAALNTIGERAKSLAQLARRPDWSHPQAETSEPQQLGRDRTEPDRSEVSIADGPVEGMARQLLNQYLRPAKRGGGRGALSDDGWQYLTRGPQAAAAAGARKYLSSARGEALALTPYVDGSGGYVQAEQVWNEVVSIRNRLTNLAGAVRNIPGVASRLTIPTSQVSITFTKGSKATGASVTPIDISSVFGRTALTPHRKDAILKIPEEFFENPAFDAVGEIARNAERSEREGLETDILHGTGSGEIYGICTALKALYTAGATNVGITVAAGGASVTAAEVQTFDLELHAGARANGRWIFNRPGLKKVRLFRSEEGGSGTGEFLFKRALEAGAPDTLNGKPILETEFLQDKVTSGVEGDVLWLFGDPDDFWLVMAKDLQLRILEELYAAENMVGYKWTSAKDGSLVRADAFIYMRRGA